MSEKTTIKAPLPVTITIYLLAAAGLFNIIYSFTGAYASYGLFYPAVNMLVTVGLFASFAGLANMEKWGLYLFFVMLAIKFGIDLYTGAFSYWHLLLLVPAGLFIAFFRKFT